MTLQERYECFGCGKTRLCMNGYCSDCAEALKQYNLCERAYRTFWDATDGEDMAIPITLSLVAQLIDNSMYPEDERNKLIDKVLQVIEAQKGS